MWAAWPITETRSASVEARHAPSRAGAKAVSEAARQNDIRKNLPARPGEAGEPEDAYEGGGVAVTVGIKARITAAAGPRAAGLATERRSTKSGVDH